jgi:hypothetical protein
MRNIIALLMLLPLSCLGKAASSAPPLQLDVVAQEISKDQPSGYEALIRAAYAMLGSYGRVAGRSYEFVLHDFSTIDMHDAEKRAVADFVEVSPAVHYAISHNTQDSSAVDGYIRASLVLEQQEGYGPYASVKSTDLFANTVASGKLFEAPLQATRITRYFVSARIDGRRIDYVASAIWASDPDRKRFDVQFFDAVTDNPGLALTEKTAASGRYVGQPVESFMSMVDPVKGSARRRLALERTGQLDRASKPDAKQIMCPSNSRDVFGPYLSDRGTQHHTGAVNLQDGHRMSYNADTQCTCFSCTSTAVPNGKNKICADSGSTFLGQHHKIATASAAKSATVNHATAGATGVQTYACAVKECLTAQA